MLRVFVLRVSARPQGRVHVPGGGIAGWMHRWAGVTAVSRGHIWPPGGDRCGVQPRSAAHQARLHSRHLAIELVLWSRKKGGEKLMQCREIRDTGRNTDQSCSCFLLDTCRDEETKQDFWEYSYWKFFLLKHFELCGNTRVFCKLPTQSDSIQMNMCYSCKTSFSEFKLWS